MQELRANTAVKVRIGPFVDVGDGFTPETAVGNTPTNLTGVDEAELLKHNGAATVDITAATWAAITGADGWYDLSLTASHTDTEGLLDVVIQDDDVCLPVFARFMVLSQAAYDSKYAEKDTGFMDVNIKTVGRADAQETEANNLESACAAWSATRGLTGTALPAVAAGAAGGVPTDSTGKTSFNDVSAADVNAQMLDVMNVDTITLPGQVAPPLAPTHRQAIGHLYKAYRNKMDQSASTFQLYDNAGTTVDQKATVSEAAGTVTREQVASGP